MDKRYQLDINMPNVVTDFYDRVTNAIIGGAGMIGYTFAFTGDMNKAFGAAARVFNLLDR